MYFLKESTGWYFLVAVVSGTGLPARRFFTTSSTNPDLINYLMSQLYSYNTITHIQMGDIRMGSALEGELFTFFVKVGLLLILLHLILLHTRKGMDGVFGWLCLFGSKLAVVNRGFCLVLS
jgi:hypothetical protein